MDKSVIEMSHENKWMEKQVFFCEFDTLFWFLMNYDDIFFSQYWKVAIFKQEIEKLEDDSSSLEKENINLMGHLFDCNNEEFNCIK